jgi:hypothetical protein
VHGFVARRLGTLASIVLLLLATGLVHMSPSWSLRPSYTPVHHRPPYTPVQHKCVARVEQSFSRRGRSIWLCLDALGSVRPTNYSAGKRCLRQISDGSLTIERQVSGGLVRTMLSHSDRFSGHVRGWKRCLTRRQQRRSWTVVNNDAIQHDE